MSNKKILMIIGAGLLAALALYLTLRSTRAALIGFFIGLLAGFGLVGGEKKRVEPPPPPAPEPPAAERKFLAIGDQLVEATFALREQAADPALCQRFDRLVDRLLPTLEEMVERYPGEELTWELGRIGAHHAPALLRHYLALGFEDRRARLEESLNALDLMINEIEAAAELVRKNQNDEFAHRAAVIKTKYS